MKLVSWLGSLSWSLILLFYWCLAPTPPFCSVPISRAFCWCSVPIPRPFACPQIHAFVSHIVPCPPFPFAQKAKYKLIYINH
jgi:hypothetical protein